MDSDSLLEKYKLQIGLGLVGLILVGLGVLLVRQPQQESVVEIIPTEESEEASGTILVDLEGAIEKPGVYELPAESRMNDLLVRAGGLSVDADREWIEKNINLAQKLADGIKIYLPRQGSEKDLAGQIVGGSTSQININTASTSQLDSLWGIGEKRAEAIISNRPYQTIEEMKDKASIPSNVFEHIKDQITVY